MVTANSSEDKPKKTRKAKPVEVSPVEVKIELPPVEKAGMTPWVEAIMKQYVNNSSTIARECIEESKDEMALVVGKQILLSMRDKSNWIKRTSEDKWDFVMRWNLESKEPTKADAKTS